MRLGYIIQSACNTFAYRACTSYSRDSAQIKNQSEAMHLTVVKMYNYMTNELSIHIAGLGVPFHFVDEWNDVLISPRRTSVS